MEMELKFEIKVFTKFIKKLIVLILVSTSILTHLLKL